MRLVPSDFCSGKMQQELGFETAREDKRAQQRKLAPRARVQCNLKAVTDFDCTFHFYLLTTLKA